MYRVMFNNLLSNSIEFREEFKSSLLTVEEIESETVEHTTHYVGGVGLCR